MNNLKNILSIFLIAVLVYCLFFGSCRRSEGLENMKLEEGNDCEPLDEEKCLRNSLREKNVPTPEGYENFY